MGAQLQQQQHQRAKGGGRKEGARGELSTLIKEETRSKVWTSLFFMALLSFLSLFFLFSLLFISPFLAAVAASFSAASKSENNNKNKRKEGRKEKKDDSHQTGQQQPPLISFLFVGERVSQR